MEVFATFDVIDEKGDKVAEGHKASFCLEDNLCETGVEARYACANYGDQGKKSGGRELDIL
jgi:lysyl oxidase-like protein 2/3/4